MLKNITRALSLSLLVTIELLSPTLNAEPALTPLTSSEMLDKYGTGFASLEHRNIGDLVTLHMPQSFGSSQLSKLTLANGLELTYGDIVMYGGDMFGDPNHPVSSCAEKDRSTCFTAQFNAMALPVASNKQSSCHNPINQANNIALYMKKVELDLDHSRTQGIEDIEFYNKHDVELTKKLNKFTCGGSIISGYIPFGNYIKLAQTNFDHFAPDSVTAYKAGHKVALETALQGYHETKAGRIEAGHQLLILAYAQNAFANHYLTDSFSAGHMRTPRRDIAKQILLPAVLKLLIANLMHNEDNAHGLNVVNAEGTSWTAYGDGFLFNPEAKEQKEILLDAMQRSADGVFKTFKSGVISAVYPEMAVFPDYSKIEQMNDTAPLFKVENGVLLKRVSNSDHYDHHWTRNWSGLVTLIQFAGVGH